jgi:hypothetical protein
MKSSKNKYTLKTILLTLCIIVPVIAFCLLCIFEKLNHSGYAEFGSDVYLPVSGRFDKHMLICLGFIIVPILILIIVSKINSQNNRN